MYRRLQTTRPQSQWPSVGDDSGQPSPQNVPVETLQPADSTLKDDRTTYLCRPVVDGLLHKTPNLSYLRRTLLESLVETRADCYRRGKWSWIQAECGEDGLEECLGGVVWSASKPNRGESQGEALGNKQGSNPLSVRWPWVQPKGVLPGGNGEVRLGEAIFEMRFVCIFKNFEKPERCWTRAPGRFALGLDTER